LFLVIPLVAVIFLYQTRGNSSGSTTLTFSGISFLPEDQEIINKSESVSIAYKKDSTVSPKILVSETKIRVKNSITSFKAQAIYLGVFFAALAIFGLEQLKRMIKTVETGTPFLRINVWRIYILSTLFFLVPLTANLGSYLQERWLISNFEFSGMVLEDNSINSFPWFMAGVLLLTIGKILEQGIKIQEEQDLTI
ncbi:MAG: DUF2975 domain-containing protein, partial [Bacteroidota bacterium]